MKWGRNGGDGTSGSLNGEFNTPEGIDVDGAGNVYVADTLNNRVQVFAPERHLPPVVLRADRVPTSALNLPGGVAVSGAGIAFVADTYDYRVMVFRPPAPGLHSGDRGTQPAP